MKCEKFYLGFDIYGLKLAKFRWGETEYGIGILPLGGYVKMLGQDDNPANAAEERERSTTARPTERPAAASRQPAPPTARRTLLDPRSYMAKSVPQRMAIISAGVIMNVIFAFVMAVIAYSLGVREMACGISAVLPGEAAWKANLQPGDRILEIDDSGDAAAISRSDERPWRWATWTAASIFAIEREGVDKPFLVNVKPDPDKNACGPRSASLPPQTTTLSDEKATFAGTPAAETGAFKPGDRIVRSTATPVATLRRLLAELDAPSRTRPLRVEVERTAKPAAKDERKTTGRGRDVSRSKCRRGRCARWAW